MMKAIGLRDYLEQRDHLQASIGILTKKVVINAFAVVKNCLNLKQSLMLGVVGRAFSFQLIKLV